MTFTQDMEKELQQLIDTAVRKVNGSKENDLCKFLPGPTGGYIHHFTMRKMKHSDPQQLASLIQEFVIKTETPRPLDPKPRAPRGSRKKPNLFSLSRGEIDRVIELAKDAGDNDLIARLAPKRSLGMIKRELVRSIRREEINDDLWRAYRDSVSDDASTSDDSRLADDSLHTS